MRRFAKLGIVALLASPLGALAVWGDSSARVEMFTPGVGNGAIERFTARFNTPMVPLGDPRAPSPFDAKCSTTGQGRWVDQQTFVYEFASPLPGGISCEFILRDKLKTLDGYALGGRSSFTIDSGGPIAREILPNRYGTEIEEDQVFLVSANQRVDLGSVAANAHCAVDGIGEKIPVDLLPADTASNLLKALGPDRWEVQSFLSGSGLPDALPEKVEDRVKALSSVVALKCRRPLPPGRDMAVIWGKDIKSPSGRMAGSDQRFDFTVRKPFTARFECSRVNPQAGCNPVRDAFVRFSAPIPREQAEQVRITLPDGKQLQPLLSDEDKNKAAIADLKFKGPLPASVTAQLTLPTNVADESGRKLSNAERFPLEVKFDAPPPLVKFAADFGILEAKEGGVLPVTVRNVEPTLQGNRMDVGGQTLRVKDSDKDVAEWLRALSNAANSKYDEVKRGAETVRVNQTGAKPLLTGATGKPFRLDLPGKGKEFEVVGIPLERPGFYIVELASPQLGQALLGRNAPRYVAAGALVTNMSVHFKWGREQSLVWVTALDNGLGVSADVQITDSCTGTLLARGKTDASGRLSVPAGLPKPETYANCENGDAAPLMISARSGEDFSFTLTDWGQGIRPYDFDLRYGWSDPNDVFHSVFDRALVRQGETIHMKHIVRKPIGSGFSTSPAFTGTLRLSHRGSDTQYDLPLSIDDNGTGESSWTAPAGAKMGDYDLQVILREGSGERTIWTDQSFKVDEYKLPTMRASVNGPKEAAVRPRTLPLDLFVGYLSGGGAANLPVEIRVAYEEEAFRPKGYEAYRFGGREMREGTRPMNGEGDDESSQPHPTQTLPATLGADGTARTTIDVPQTLDQRTTMQVEMDYQDANGQILTASRRVPIYPAKVQLGVKTDGWLMKQNDLRLKLIALDTDGNPIANQAVSVELYSRQILTARRRLIGGFYAYDNQMRTTRLGATCSGRTDPQGAASCKLSPGVSGEVYVVATTKDADGNTARATQSVWLVGEDDWWFGGDNGDRMDVIPERLEYKAGETARFQVRMPFREATALVTVEREGVLSSFVTGLTGKDPVIEVPMPAAYAPDVFVSVMAVRGRVSGFRNWRAEMARNWGLPFFSQEGGAPTATVDLAKPAFRLGIAKVKVGWEGHKLDVTVKADKPVYAARESAAVEIAVKLPDGKPAAKADLAFVAVDEALLQLAPNPSWNVLDAMMGDRPLSVLTATAQTQVVGKRHYGRKAVEAGGGGGAGDLSGLNRENFQPVLLWKGSVALDAEGKAKVTVPLNDALTAFKLVAVATEGTNHFGTGETSVRSAQDLTIYSGVPSLVRSGDSFGAIFTLRNGSDRPMRVTAEVNLSPRIATGKPLTVEIPAGGAAPIVWNLTTPETEGRVTWSVTARSADGKAVDQLTTVQEIIRAVPVETWAANLTRIGANSNIPIAPPQGALPGLGAVELSLTDTLAPPLQGVREYMTRYPYTCIEQRSSMAVALGDAAMWDRIVAELPAYIDNDGLVRYFPGDAPGSEALTAHLLSISSEAGLPIPPTSRAKMIAALTAVLDGRLRHEDYGDVRLQRLAAFTALARNGAANAGMVGQIGIGINEMPTSSLADYAMALGKVEGLANGQQLRVDAERVLRSRLVYEGTRIDLADKGKMPWWLMASDDEAAIKALLATLGRPGWQDETAKMMVGLSMRQQRGRWDTTTANAWGAVAARRFNAAYPAETISGVTQASFGSTQISRNWPLAMPQRVMNLALPSQPTPLLLSQSGGSGPWAFVRVKAAVPLTEPLFAGYKATKKVEAVKQASPNGWTRGDVVKVTITVEASAERNWVVINDPIPSGATIVGSLGGQSAMLAAQGATIEGVAPSFTEGARDAWRAYYGWVPRGSFTISYVMRLDTAGRFNLPATRVEAMYSPEIRAQLPNQPMVVAQR